MVSVGAEDKAAVGASSLFDAGWYCANYPDVSALQMDPLEHFLWIGWELGRSPGPNFCTKSYLSANPDVERIGLNPLIHYIRSGKKEGRPTYPVITSIERSGRKLAKRILVRRHKEWDVAIEKRAVDNLVDVKRLYAKDLVSIVMPTKDRGHCIDGAISSALAQTHTNLELIVIDDGSSDDTKDRVSAFSDSRVRYIALGNSRGVAAARNVGLKQANGRWVFFLDSDNSWRSSMVETMLKHADKVQCSAGYCAANIIGDDGERKSVLYADFDFESCLSENYIDLNCFFIRRDSLGSIEFDEGLRRLVDWDYILRVASHTRVVGIPYIGVEYSDGSAVRITNSVYTDPAELLTLRSNVRNKAKRYILEAGAVRDISSYKIAVVFHVFHPEAVKDCLDYLRNILFDVDLLVTTPLELSNPAIKSVTDAYPSARVFRFPNVGADIAPFVELLSTLKNYFLVCKMHTKRAGGLGDKWREVLLKSVLGDPAGIIQRFKNNPHLKLVGSKELYMHGRKNSIAETLEQTRVIAESAGLSDVLQKEWGFIAGSMFWCRPNEFLRLARFMCESSGYSQSFRRDGGPEHGIERALGLCLWTDKDARVGLVDYGGVYSEHRVDSVNYSRVGVAATVNGLQ